MATWLRTRHQSSWTAIAILGIALVPLSSLGEPLADIALGLPPVEIQADDSHAAVQLGRTLFFDVRLSGSGSTSCATCHNPAKALADGLRVSVGERGQQGTRNAPSLINARFNDSFFWDGRRGTLEEQAIDPFLNPTEHGLRDAVHLLEHIKADPAYVRGFAAAYRVGESQIETVHVARALGAFQRTLVAGDTPFDRYYYKGDKSALSESAARGLKVFRETGQCASCHTIGEKSALFTDQKFHRLSVGIERIEQKLAGLTRTLVERRGKGDSLDHLVLEDPDLAELGRFAVTLNPLDIGKFRTPSLRNVALTAPYMHDGSLKTLEEAVELEIYYRGAARGYPLILTLQERDDLVSFMRALTSPHVNKWTP